MAKVQKQILDLIQKRKQENEYYEELLYNYFMDLRKKDVDRFARAKIIRTYMEKEKLSEPEFAKRLGVPKSTVYDWMIMDKITEDQYETLKTKGLKDTQIYRVLRGNTPIKEIKHIEEITRLDSFLEEYIRDIKSFTSGLTKDMISNMTDDLAHELINQLGRLRLEIDKVQKR